MPQVGFEPKIPVFERAKTVHALDRAAAVMGRPFSTLCICGAECPALHLIVSEGEYWLRGKR
jgi:hypothetical protein